MTRRYAIQPPAAAEVERCRTVTKAHFAAAALLGLVAVLPIRSPDGAEVRPVRSLIEMRQDGVVLQAFDLSCGAAALATILTYEYGDRVPEREIAKELLRRKEYLEHPELVRIREGFSLADLKRYVDGRGYEGIGYGQLKLGDLIDFAPILVPISSNGYNHFVVFRGIQNGRVLLADPAYGNRTMRADRFENMWLNSPEFGRVGFVVAKRDGGAHPPNRLAPKPDQLVLPSNDLLRAVLPFSGSR